MGSSSSKVELPEAPDFNLSSRATVPVVDAQDFEDQAKAAYDNVAQTAQNLINQNSSLLNEVSVLSVIAVIATGFILYYFWTPISTWFISFVSWLSSSSTSPSSPEDNFTLIISSAVLTSSSQKHNPLDITSLVAPKVSNNVLDIPVDESIGAVDGDTLSVQYTRGLNGQTQTVSAAYKTRLQIVLVSPQSSSSSGVSSSSSSGSSSGSSSNLPTKKDAKVQYTIQSGDGPKVGPYGYQFWMYVTDWNYKFGQEKQVFTRNDPAGTISSPQVTLSPTDNTMKISVSVFPNENTSKNEPAPSGSSSSNDDVFICEVPNIPIQRWVAVGVTTDTKNLDVYLDGNLVKSCMLTGVPKPALGDIVLNNQGGFAGWMCSFNMYSKMLGPSDTQAFAATGAPCSIDDGSSFKTQFGFFNSSGKEVSKYVF
jgi:hypothetical protein